MNLHRVYHNGIPDFLRDLSHTPEMRRLSDVGMNCGCEYTHFPRFCGLGKYSRYEHSLGAALIVWHFTGDRAQSAAALFHDIATPAFAHSIDFLRGDYLTQEATEDGTEAIIRSSEAICRLLAKEGLTVEQVRDYHQYPIADNDSPRLSADRLEYTLGNLVNFGFCLEEQAAAYYDALLVAKNGEGVEELCFPDEGTALAFARDAMRCARIYVSDEDRYAMQRLSEVIALALSRGALCEKDLCTTETEVIGKLHADVATKRAWDRFTSLSGMVTDPEAAPPEDRRVIPAKRRYIDPYVAGKGRLSALNAAFAAETEAFLHADQASWICGR